MYDDELNAYDAADRATPPPARPILFYGSSSIRLWTTLAQDFPGLPLLNRAFGGSMLSECVHLMDRLVLKYAPRAVVLYAGNNDLCNGRSPSDILRSFREFMTRYRQALPERPLAYISVHPSLARIHLRREIEETNTLIENEITRWPNTTFISIFDAMLDANGRPRRELFVDDLLHLSPEGYAVWREIVRPYLKPWAE